jgi:AraC-like DNA-binding protein
VAEAIQIKNGNKALEYAVESALTSYHTRYIAENYSVKYAVQGDEHYWLDGKKYRLKEGQFLVVNPGQEIEIEIDASSEVVGNCFFFDPMMVNVADSSDQVFADSTWISSRSEYSNLPTNIHGTTFESILKNPQLQRLHSEDQTSDLLVQVLESMLGYQSNLKTQVSSLSAAKKTTQLEIYRRIQLGRQFMHDNLSQKIALTAIAEAAQLSDYHFHRNFRTFFQQTPQQYLQSIRLEKARELHKVGQYTLAEIAVQCGYFDLKYFRKTCIKLNVFS